MEDTFGPDSTAARATWNATGPGRQCGAPAVRQRKARRPSAPRGRGVLPQSGPPEVFGGTESTGRRSILCGGDTGLLRRNTGFGIRRKFL